MKEVLWAMMTRVDPPTNIDIIDGCWRTPLDPRMPPEKRDIAGEVLASLADADDASYAWACEALAQFEPTEDMSAATIPVHSAVGEHDFLPAKPGMDVFTGCAHLPPAEDPRAVASYLVAKGLAA
jgi:pimeloyl-ACP methyl ester carboxylesterase